LLKFAIFSSAAIHRRRESKERQAAAEVSVLGLRAPRGRDIAYT